MNPVAAYALIVAAGKGLRMESSVKKQYLLLQGVPILTRTVQAFHTHPDIREILLVVPEQDLAYCRSEVLEAHGLGEGVRVMPGGARRQDSVWKGLCCLRDRLRDEKDAVVIIHDGVRPFVDHSIIRQGIHHVLTLGACVPGIPITDTVKQVFPDRRVRATLDRNTLYRIQTPQCFDLHSIVKAFEYARKTGFIGTDDASVYEHSGQRVHVFQGDPTNIKITTRQDLSLASFYLSKALGAAS